MAFTLFSVLRNSVQRIAQSGLQSRCQFHKLAAPLSRPHISSTSLIGNATPLLSQISQAGLTAAGQTWSLIPVRYKGHGFRTYFPRPRESKRIKFTWKYRMATLGGRKIIMRRILRGRYVICHPDW